MSTQSIPTPLEVAVLAGGRSSEHEVSLSSAAAVRDGLLAGGHRVVWVEIGRDGVWRRDGRELSVTPGRGLFGVDVVFPVLHGPFGEDGSVQGLLEALDVAYVGAGVAASAVCLDKVLFKELMSALSIPQVDYVGVRAERFAGSRRQVLEQVAALGLPVFVKPAHLGSSVGIVKVSDAEGMDAALEQAFAHDPLVIVEAMARGLEVECGVIGSVRGERDGGAPAAIASQPGEIVIPGEWYDYEAKYTPGGMELKLAPVISPQAIERVRELAVSTFLAAGCEGLARVDFFVDGETVVVNELNTMPGFTPTSVYAKLFDASGIAYPLLVERLCRLAQERHAERRAYSF
ncbi:MAG: D-alanine--D-alanine ligase family protein [Solirubrobacteraceae bacterium]